MIEPFITLNLIVPIFFTNVDFFKRYGINNENINKNNLEKNSCPFTQFFSKKEGELLKKEVQ